MLLLTFKLDTRRYALDLSNVERVARAVEVTPLPETSEAILGLVNMHGRVIPVVNIRRLFCLPEKDIDLSDRLIIARTPTRMGVFLADDVAGVIEYPEQNMIQMSEIEDHSAEFIKGVVKLDDGMAIVLDCDILLTHTDHVKCDDRVA